MLVPINSEKIEGLKMNGKVARRGRNRGTSMDDLYRQLSIYYVEKHHELLVLCIIRTLLMQRHSAQKVVHGVSTPPAPNTGVLPDDIIYMLCTAQFGVRRKKQYLMRWSRDCRVTQRVSFKHPELIERAR
jgi:hypothetical protein